MFRQLASVVGANQVLTGYRPAQLSEYLEMFWATARLGVRQSALGGVTALHQQMARPATIDPLAPRTGGSATTGLAGRVAPPRLRVHAREHADGGHLPPRRVRVAAR
jgi:hypothetical protein